MRKPLIIATVALVVAGFVGLGFFLMRDPGAGLTSLLRTPPTLPVGTIGCGAFTVRQAQVNQGAKATFDLVATFSNSPKQSPQVTWVIDFGDQFVQTFILPSPAVVIHPYGAAGSFEAKVISFSAPGYGTGKSSCSPLKISSIELGGDSILCYEVRGETNHGVNQPVYTSLGLAHTMVSGPIPPVNIAVDWDANSSKNEREVFLNIENPNGSFNIPPHTYTSPGTYLIKILGLSTNWDYPTQIYAECSKKVVVQ